MNWYLAPWQKYLQYTGRARRLEYWAFWLGNTLIGLALFALAGAGMDIALTLYGLFALAAMIPGIMVGIRRTAIGRDLGLATKSPGTVTAS